MIKHIPNFNRINYSIFHSLRDNTFDGCWFWNNLFANLKNILLLWTPKSIPRSIKVRFPTKLIALKYSRIEQNFWKQRQPMNDAKWQDG